jgi:hypothetical protein
MEDRFEVGGEEVAYANLDCWIEKYHALVSELIAQPYRID